MRTRKEIGADDKNKQHTEGRLDIVIEVLLDIRELLNMICYTQGAFKRSPIESASEKEKREKGEEDALKSGRF